MRNLPMPPLDVNQRYTIEEANAYLRQSRAKTYFDIKEGKLAIIKDGKRTYIPGRAIADRSDLPDIPHVIGNPIIKPKSPR